MEHYRKMGYDEVTDSKLFPRFLSKRLDLIGVEDDAEIFTKNETQTGDT